jgi:hypothetical protein
MTEPWTHNVMAVNGFRMHYVTKRKKGAPISSICANLSGKCQCGLEKIDLGAQTVA